ncbi:MAG: glycosyltransferase family 4 protein [Planctomycetia bacterium]|nr:glycosyltransferase family 4 protein [Planctomycetia bacterium]
MNILQINHLYRPFGGGERYLLDLCNILEESGHGTVIVSSRHPQNYHIKGRKEYFIDGSFGLKSGLKMWKVVRDIVRLENPHLIHFHETLAFLSPFILRRLMRLKPTIQTLHTAFYFCPKTTKILPNRDICFYAMGFKCITNGCLPEINLRLALNMLWRKWVTAKADRVVVPSLYIKEEAVRNGIASEKVAVIPHFTEKNLQNKYVEPEGSSILFMGRTDPLKGIHELIAALNLIKEKTWKAYILGIGDDLNEYEKMAQDMGIKARIMFLNNLDYADLDKYYQRASVVVFPSMSPESFGLVGIEAMSFGRPVVAFDVGGPREWLVDEKTGFLVKRGDVKGLSLRINQFLEDASLAKQMGLEGQRRVNRRYRKEIHLKRLLTIYEEALETRRQKDWRKGDVT